MPGDGLCWWPDPATRYVVVSAAGVVIAVIPYRDLGALQILPGQTVLQSDSLQVGQNA